MRFTPSLKPFSWIFLVVLASSCSKDITPDSLLGADDPVPEFRDLIAAGAEDVPASDSLFCWYEIFDCWPHHRLSPYNVAVGMYASFPCQQPCTDTIEHTIYQYAPSKGIWLWDHAKMVAMDDSCWAHAAVDLNAVWSDSEGKWVIPSMPWQ